MVFSSYGTIVFPLDKWVDTFHDGSENTHQRIIKKQISN